MSVHRLALALAVPYLCAAAASCGEEETPQRTRGEFCSDFAAAACSEETLSACQAKNADECERAQDDFCRSQVSEDGFSDAHGDECIDAVSDAYEDADLSDEELATVLRFGPPCDQLLRGPKAEGESCASRRDCDASAGFDCVKKASATAGTCEQPDEVGGGRDCTAQQKVCEDGFYCNGENCVEGKATGADCSNEIECAQDAFCDEDGTCRERFAIGEPCDADAQCASGICYVFDDETVCTDRIVLSRSEPICTDLR